MSYSYDQRRKARNRAKKLNPVVNEMVAETPKKEKKEIPALKHFKTTFTENSKYNPVTRTLIVNAYNKQAAENLIHNRFGSFVYKCLLGFPKIKWPTVPSNKITISSCVEIDKDGNVVPEVVSEVVAGNATTEKPKRSRKKKSDDLPNQSLATSEAITI